MRLALAAKARCLPQLQGGHRYSGENAGGQPRRPNPAGPDALPGIDVEPVPPVQIAKADVDPHGSADEQAALRVVRHHLRDVA